MLNYISINKLYFPAERLGESVGFNGNGYLVLPPNLLTYDKLESVPTLIALAFVAQDDGVLLYQREANVSPDHNSDFILLRGKYRYIFIRIFYEKTR